MIEAEWLRCPLCGGKTRNKLRKDTELKHYPLFCPKCKQEVLINAKLLNITIIAAITSATGKRYLPSHIIIGEGFGLSKPSMVMLEQQRTVNKNELIEFIGHIDSNNINRKIHNGLMKVYGYWDYTRYNTANIRCLCRDCLQIYRALPEFIVTRVNPLSKVKEKCDKCEGFGYDYFVYERNP